LIFLTLPFTVGLGELPGMLFPHHDHLFFRSWRLSPASTDEKYRDLTPLTMLHIQLQVL